MPTPFDAVTTYLLAKDGNRPFLMRHAFAEDAHLEMVVRTDAITFPATADGLAAIADTLSRRFAADFENAWTFALARPTDANRRHFPCHWLVGLAAKADGAIRVGAGRYDWYFTPDEASLVERLIITIDVMEILPPARQAAVFDWLSALPYPWCSPDDVLRGFPPIDQLAPVEAYLRAVGPIQPEH